MARRTREEARQQTRERLLESARICFARSGFAGASVDVIAEAADYSKGAFYSNFETKEAIFLVLLEQYLDTEIARGRGIVDEGNFEMALSQFVELYSMEDEDQNWCLLSVEFALHAARSDRFGEQYSKLFQRHYQQIAQILESLAALSGGSLENALLAATKFVAFRRGLALDRSAQSPSLSQEDVKHSLTSFLFKVLNLYRA